MRRNKLVTVCEEANCPNIGECWHQRYASFMIMGKICTRACAFCNVATGIPLPLDSDEPERIARAIEQMDLRHVVITSVDRDDHETLGTVRRNKLVTVCEEANCPNIGECWHQRYASFMIMGKICTRACAFCNVATGIPLPLDSDEPERIARAIEQMDLRHVVITSVDRDDLPDGGARHFATVIFCIRKRIPQATIEVLTPDFRNKNRALEIIVSAHPDVFNHNLETVPSKYLTVRPGARYFYSIRLLQRVKELDPSIFTKSGIMVGLGEERNEILQLMDDLRSADVDFMTIGQYLQPTRKHHPVIRFVTPDEFESYATIGRSKGFLHIASSPLTRSSHHAADDFEKLKSTRSAHLANEY